MYFSLKQDYKIRKAERGILLYTLNELGDIQDQKMIHPNSAILLALLDGERKLEDLNNTIAYLFNLSESEVDALLKKFLDEWKPYLCEVDPQSRDRINKYDPRSFVMNAKTVDLTHYRLSTPINLVFIVTDRCSRKCIYCYGEQEFAPERIPLSFERIKEILKEASELGVTNIIFSGEPFKRQDILAVIEETISEGIIPLLSTKEYLSNYTVEKLRDIGLTRIQLSIDSAVPEIADFLTGSNGYFLRMAELIDCLQEHNIEVTINTVATPYNVYTIPHLARWLLGKNIRKIRISQYGRSIYRHSDDLFLSEDHVKWLKPYIAEIEQEYPKAEIKFASYFSEITDSETRINKFLSRPRCMAGKYAIVINPDGAVTICEQLPSTQEFIVGDLSHQSIMEVWNSPRLKNLIYPPKEAFQGTGCYFCKHYDQCIINTGRCIRDTLKAYGTIYTVDPRCPKSSTSVRLF
jgi:radical SAM protein with 4Fe4S-binding SPASM domain